MLLHNIATKSLYFDFFSVRFTLDKMIFLQFPRRMPLLWFAPRRARPLRRCALDRQNSSWRPGLQRSRTCCGCSCSITKALNRPQSDQPARERGASQYSAVGHAYANEEAEDEQSDASSGGSS